MVLDAIVCALSHGESLNTTWNRRFRAAFGVSFGVLLVVWDLLDPVGAESRPKYRREHLLWALYFFENLYYRGHISNIFWHERKKPGESG